MLDVKIVRYNFEIVLRSFSSAANIVKLCFTNINKTEYDLIAFSRVILLNR